MNDLEKKSFYSFLGLYIVTSLMFIMLVGYWYFIAQKSAFENETYYKLEHLADVKAGDIIVSHMQQTPLKPIKIPHNITMALIDTNNKIIKGSFVDPSLKITPGYFKHNGYNILISDAPREHLGIRYIVLQTTMPADQIVAVKALVLRMILVIFFLIVCVAWILSKLFMKPVHQRVAQIERFINDVTHELNTPITSLSMSAQEALKAGECTPKMLNNISISTKQLYDIYRSLTYLNFSDKKEISEPLDLKEVIEESIDYYRPLAEIKRIHFELDIEDAASVIPKQQLTLLLGNLIGNAIKYSSPRSTITILLKDRVLEIRDEGIGIDLDKQKEIFEKFKRGTDYSGGFGVGLNIVKSICDTYDIQIELDSFPEKGTTFKLKFS